MINIPPHNVGLLLFCSGLFFYAFLPEKSRQIIITTAILHRIYFFFISPIPVAYGILKGHMLGDPFLYHQQAFLISEFPGLLSYHRPFYPSLISVIYSITSGRNYKIMIFIQHLIGVGAALIVYEIVKKILGKKWAFVLGLLSACLYYFVKMEGALATESLGLFFAISAIYLLMVYQESNKKSFCAMAGLSIAYSNMMRPIAIAATLPLAAYILYIDKGRKDFWKGALLFLSMAALLTFFWIGFNYISFGVATTSKSGTESFWVATNPKYGDFCKKGIMEALSKSDSRKELHEILVREIKENLVKYPANYLKNVLRVFVHAVRADNLNDIYEYKKNIRLRLILILTLIVIFDIYRRRKINFHRLPFLFVPIILWRATSGSSSVYIAIWIQGLWVLLSRKRNSGFIVIFFISIILAVSIFSVDLHTARVCRLIQWVRDIFFIASFAYLAEWVERGTIAYYPASEPLCIDVKKHYKKTVIIFSFFSLWAITGLCLLLPSGLKYSKYQKTLAEFAKSSYDSTELTESQNRINAISKIVGEYYKPFAYERNLVLNLLKSKKEFEEKISAFPELYSWYTKNDVSMSQPQLLIGNIDYDFINLDPGEGYSLDPFIFGSRPNRRTIFFMINYPESYVLPFASQKLLPIPGFKNRIWLGNYRVVVPGGLKDKSLDGKKVFVFGERIETKKPFFWDNDMFKAKFVLEYKRDIENNVLNLTRIF